jgi:hypothetical protein
MTWEELTEKYKEYCDDDEQPSEFIVEYENLNLYLCEEGWVRVHYRESENCYVSVVLSADRTPEQMDNIIKNLTEGK